MTLIQKAELTGIRLLKAYARKKMKKAKKLESKMIDLELKVFAEIHGYNKKKGLEDVN